MEEEYQYDFTLDAKTIRGDGVHIGDDTYVHGGYMYSFHPKGSDAVSVVSIALPGWPQRIVWMATDLYEGCLDNVITFLVQAALMYFATYVGDQPEVLAAIKDKREDT